jgi:hypothetical protein
MNSNASEPGATAGVKPAAAALPGAGPKQISKPAESAGAALDPGTPCLSREAHPRPRVTGPSFLYRAGYWRAGVFMSRRIPHFLFGTLASHFAKIYWLASSARRRVVFENVLPALNGDRMAARITTRELFQQFALKLADLWRYERIIDLQSFP